MQKYQGKEFQSTLQAPDSKSLSKLIRSARKYARENQMENFRILEKGSDPDGGYRAIVTAHNWNPISWIKEKISGKKKPLPEEEIDTSMTEESRPAEPEDVEKFKAQEFEKWRKEEEKRQKLQDIEMKYAKKRQEITREGKEKETAYSSEQYKEALLEKVPIEAREEARKEYPKTTKQWAQTAYSIWSEKVPDEIIEKHKVTQEEYWTKKGTDIKIPKPRTREEEEQTDYHPKAVTYIDVSRKLSPVEQAQVARQQELDRMRVDIARESYKQFKRERKPIYRTAKAIGGVGQFMAGAVTMGVAGMARGARPGKGGPERAMRMHAPGLPLDLYAVKPVLGVGMPSAKDLTGAGLGHLRALTLPGIRKTKKQVQQVRRSVEP